MQLVVIVVGSWREKLLKGVDEAANGVAIVIEPVTDALLKVPCGCVIRAVKCFVVFCKEVCVLRENSLVDIDNVKTGSRR